MGGGGGQLLAPFKLGDMYQYDHEHTALDNYFLLKGLFF